MNNNTQVDECIAFLANMADSISTFIGNLTKKNAQRSRLAEFEPGEVVCIGSQEMIILEQHEGETSLITRNIIGEETAFSDSNNNYVGSYVDDICISFAEMLEDLVGSDNVVEFVVDLTSNDGLKDYGQITRKASLMTAGMYRRYVAILDQHKLDAWWWLSTPFSTPQHKYDSAVLCVSPSGYVFNNHYGNFVNGVRPFCILKSDIFVSC